MSSSMVPLISLGILVVFGIIFFVVTKGQSKSSKANKTSSKNSGKTGSQKAADTHVSKEDIFKFMEFDKIQDNMIIQNNGEKYTAVIKCKGINYNLMSEVEQLAVEEGFMNFLNTLKFPIQLYVQAQSVNLKSNIADYRQNMRGLHEEYDEVNSSYNMVLNSLESTDEEIQQIEDERNSILNVLEYGQDIVKYVEKLSLNKSMLQRSFYVLVSYYKSELSNASSFKKEELLDICYQELFTRVQNIMSGLTMCSVYGEILNSNTIAELLYSAYNRDDKNFMSVQQALESGFYRLYSTSEDAIMKKNKKLIETMKQEAEYKAISALNKALEEGTYTSKEDIEDEFDQETSKQAIEIIKKERVSDEVKQKAKKIIVEEYKEAKKERLQKQEEDMIKLKENLDKVLGTNAQDEQIEPVVEVKNESENNEENIDPNETVNDADDAIV